MIQDSASYDMERDPLTKSQVRYRERDHASCLGKEIIMMIKINGVLKDGVCRQCHDYRNCRRVRRGDPPLPPLRENEVARAPLGKQV